VSDACEVFCLACVQSLQRKNIPAGGVFVVYLASAACASPLQSRRAVRLWRRQNARVTEPGKMTGYQRRNRRRGMPASCPFTSSTLVPVSHIDALHAMHHALAAR
jgi:hypothetical protein